MTSIESQKKTLFTLHDEIAGYKAEYDADKEIDQANLAWFLLFLQSFRKWDVELPKESNNSPCKVPSSWSCARAPSFVEKSQSSVHDVSSDHHQLDIGLMLFRCSKAAMEHKKLTRPVGVWTLAIQNFGQ